MYSEDSQKQIQKIERENFRNLKKQENKKKIIPVTDDILYMSDFTIKKFSHSGDSGDLYLATSKHNSNKKYILKHEYYDSACNEYMYSKIGNKMGISIAPVKLFILDDKEDKFKSDFVCGIQYLEGCEHINFDYVCKNKDNIDNWQDYFKMICLEILFDESDGVEIVKYGHKIYRIDTTASFTISDFFLHSLAYDYEKNGINIRKFANKTILKMAERNTALRLPRWKDDVDNILERYGKEYLPYYLEPYRLLENVTEKDLKEWCSILTIFYPDIIGDYYQNYFSNLKLDVQEFLAQMEKQVLVTV